MHALNNLKWNTRLNRNAIENNEDLIEQNQRNTPNVFIDCQPNQLWERIKKK